MIRMDHSKKTSVQYYGANGNSVSCLVRSKFSLNFGVTARIVFGEKRFAVTSYSYSLVGVTSIFSYVLVGY